MILHDKKITFILNIHTNFCFFPTILHFDNIPKEWMYHSIISLHKSNQNLYVHVFEAFVSWQNMFEERETLQKCECEHQRNAPSIIIEHKYVDTAVFISFSFLRFSGLSLVLNKEGLWLKRLTLTLSKLKGEWQVKSVLIHTSCRSESSNISLVVLDKK